MFIMEGLGNLLKTDIGHVIYLIIPTFGKKN